MVLQVKPEEIKRLTENPSEIFFSSLKVPATRRNYISCLKKILCEFLGPVLKGDQELINQQIDEYKKQNKKNKKSYWDADFEVRINEFVRRTKGDPSWTVSTLQTLAAKFADNMNDKTGQEFRSLRSVDNYLKIVKKLCDVNNVSLNWNSVYNNLPTTDETKNETRGYTRTEIQRMLEHCRNVMDKAIIILGSSSGIRAGGFVLQWKHIKPVYQFKNKYVFEDHEVTESVVKEGKIVCVLIRVYANTDSEYFGFATPEFWNIVQEYKQKWFQDIGKEPKDEDPFFRKAGFVVRQLTKDGIEKRFLRIVKDAGLRTPLKKGQRIHDIPLFNGLRRYFNKENKRSLSKTSTLASLILKETQMGHIGLIQLDQNYFKEHIDELIEEYITAIPNLTLSDALRKEAEKIELVKKVNDLEAKQTSIDELKQSIQDIKDEVNAKAIIAETITRLALQGKLRASKENKDSFEPSEEFKPIWTEFVDKLKENVKDLKENNSKEWVTTWIDFKKKMNLYD